MNRSQDLFGGFGFIGSPYSELIGDQDKAGTRAGPKFVKTTFIFLIMFHSNHFVVYGRHFHFSNSSCPEYGPVLLPNAGDAM